MNILGLKIDGHDTCAAVISGEKVVAIAEERLCRIKHSPGVFPAGAIDYCLSETGVADKDIDLICIDSTVKEEGRSAIDIFHERSNRRFADVRVEIVNHHDAHAASAFFCSPFEDAAVLVYDGNGAKFRTNLGVDAFETETLYHGKGNTLVQIDKTVHKKERGGYPWTFGIGLLYTKICQYIALGTGNEGKLMGLAAYGDDSFLNEFPPERWMKSHMGRLVCNARIVHPPARGHLTQKFRMSLKDGDSIPSLVGKIGYVLKVRYRALRSSLVRRVLGAGNDPSLFEPIRLSRPPRDPSTDALPDKYYASVAYAAQKLFERFSFAIAARLKAITGAERLCVSGGCALNIDANHNFITQAGYKDIFIQPASSDCGIALGCALWGKHAILNQPRDWVMRSASLGRKYSRSEIEQALKKYEGRVTFHGSHAIMKEAAGLIAKGNIIGWFQGGSEYGPRALGNRSILCDASRKDMRDVLNARVKHREMWRPFAASILSERLGEWFDLRPNSATSYMLLAAEIIPEKREKVPSIVHVDHTCRMQTLTKEDNGKYYELVKEFAELTGVPLVLNTSFNLGGEPIVETPEDALRTFVSTDMDYLVLEDVIVKKVAE